VVAEDVGVAEPAEMPYDPADLREEVTAPHSTA
jgi:hypothetical protein